MSVGARLYSLRVYNKFTTEELADKLGVAKNTIYRWERNIFAPTKPKLIKLADLYGVSVDWILKGVGSEKNELERKLNIPNRPILLPVEKAESEGRRGNPDILIYPKYIPERHGEESASQDENRLVAIFNMLPQEKKYHLMGYLERMYVEEFKMDGLHK